MADSLLVAIHKKFNNSGELIALLPGGLWTSEVPESTQPAYAAIEHEGTVYEYHFSQPSGTKFIEHCQICFHVYTKTAEEADEIVDSLARIYNGGKDVLSLSTKTCMAVSPIESQIEAAMGRWEDGSMIYHGYLRVNIKLSKT